MMKAEFEKLLASTDDGINSIARLKVHAVESRQYEFAAKLRDVEIKLEEAKELIKKLN